MNVQQKWMYKLSRNECKKVNVGIFLNDGVGWGTSHDNGTFSKYFHFFLWWYRDQICIISCLTFQYELMYAPEIRVKLTISLRSWVKILPKNVLFQIDTKSLFSRWFIYLKFHISGNAGQNCKLYVQIYSSFSVTSSLPHCFKCYLQIEG